MYVFHLSTVTALKFQIGFFVPSPNSINKSCCITPISFATCNVFRNFLMCFFLQHEEIPSQALFKAYQRGELSTSILSKDDHQPTTSAIITATATTTAPVAQTSTHSGQNSGQMESGKCDVQPSSSMESGSTPSSPK